MAIRSSQRPLLLRVLSTVSFICLSFLVSSCATFVPLHLFVRSFHLFKFSRVFLCCICSIASVCPFLSCLPFLPCSSVFTLTHKVCHLRPSFFSVSFDFLQSFHFFSTTVMIFISCTCSSFLFFCLFHFFN